jgi:hypothetical protein
VFAVVHISFNIYLDSTHLLISLVGLEKFDVTAQSLHVTTAPGEQLATTSATMIRYPNVEAQTKLQERANV